MVDIFLRKCLCDALRLMTVGVGLVCVQAQAQALSGADAGGLLRQQERHQAPELRPESALAEVEEARAVRAVEEGVAVELKAVRFSGAVDEALEAQLQQVVVGVLGKRLDFAGLKALADDVAAYLRGQGNLLARAYLPRQDVTAGVLEIAIIQGRLDGAQGEGGWQISVAQGARIEAQRLAALAERAAPSGEVLKQGELERALLLINDMPGIVARSRLEPGRTPGSSRAVVEVREGPLLSAYAWADNYGSSSTGESQVNAALSLNDPLGRGDRARVNLSASEGISLVRLGYGAPVGAAGLRTDIGYTAMRYEVKNGTGVSSGLQGDSASVQAELSYPFIRSRGLNLYGSAGLVHKVLNDDSSAGVLRDKRIDAFSLEVTGDSLDRLGGSGLNNWNLRLVTGRLDLSRVAADLAADAASLKAHGHYNKLEWGASRLQRLGAGLTLSGRLAGQVAGSNLDSSERFILGGPGGVRAYPVGEAQGDEGWLASVDLRYDFNGTPLGDVQLSVFADTGGIRLHDDPSGITIANASGRNSYRISGAGIGLSIGKPGSYRLGLSWARALGSNPGRTATGNNADGESGKSRVWLQGVAWF